MTHFAFRKSIAVISASMVLSIFAGRAVAQNRSPVAPSEEAIQNTLREAYTKFKNDTNGKNADYIPYLAHVDSNLYGIAIVTTDGKIYRIGDVNYAFSIQSISKVFTLAELSQLGTSEPVKCFGIRRGQ